MEAVTVHELSIAASVLDVVEQTLGTRRPIESVHLTLGVLSGVNAHSLEFCFTELAKQEGFGTPQLLIAEVPAKVHCEDCDTLYETREFTEGCPQCQSMHREIVSGYECDVDWVRIEEEDEHVN
jgi:hydrogenase nickel incorporation protein HypA/HybF